MHQTDPRFSISINPGVDATFTLYEVDDGWRTGRLGAVTFTWEEYYNLGCSIVHDTEDLHLVADELNSRAKKIIARWKEDQEKREGNY